ARVAGDRVDGADAVGRAVPLVDDADGNVGGEERQRRTERRAVGRAGTHDTRHLTRRRPVGTAGRETGLQRGVPDDREVVRHARPTVVEVRAAGRDHEIDLVRTARRIGAARGYGWDGRRGGAAAGDTARVRGALDLELVD